MAKDITHYLGQLTSALLVSLAQALQAAEQAQDELAVARAQIAALEAAGKPPA